MFVLAAIVLTLLFTMKNFNVPYGRHNREGAGPQFDARLGWVIMESPSVILFATMYGIGANASNAVPLVFCVLWLIHYVHRTFIYPFQIRVGQANITLFVVSMGFLFNTINSYLNGRYISQVAQNYTTDWLTDPRFAIGITVFVTGFIINRQSDNILRNLRKPGEKDYKIPRGGMFKYVSCANYFGESTQWIGWAIATWSLPGLAFALWTISNLLPRARSHHRWYINHFSDYPRNRKAMIPFLY